MSASKRDALTAAVELLGALPMPVGTGPVPMKPEQRKAIAVQIGDVQPATDALIGSFAESVANVRNHEHPAWEDLYCMNLTSYMGERMAPVLKRLLDTETENARLRARVAELGAGSPWERAVAGLNALVDADVAFHVEPDGHISAPFSDEHIEWDLKAKRWVLSRDEDDDSYEAAVTRYLATPYTDDGPRPLRPSTAPVNPFRPCGCPKRFDRHAEGCPQAVTS